MEAYLLVLSNEMHCASKRPMAGWSDFISHLRSRKSSVDRCSLIPLQTVFLHLKLPISLLADLLFVRLNASYTGILL
jgi:hypothetical protein